MTSSREDGGERPLPRRRWRRRVLVLVALLVLVLLAPIILLRSDSFRQMVLDRTVSALRDGLGISATARDFELDLTSGQLVLVDVALAAPGGPAPFLTVPKATAELAWRDLLRAPRVIRRLQLDAPVWNLDAPLTAESATSGEAAPTRDAPTGDADPDAPAALEVHEIVIHDGVVLSERAPPGLERWFTALRWHELEGVGAFRDGFRLGFGPAPLHLENVPALDEHLRAPPVDLALALGFDLGVDGRLRFDPIALDGDGLALRADGSGRFGEGESFDLRFELDSQPGKLLAGVPMTSALSGNGELELNRLQGTVALAAREVPAEIVRPWLGSADGALDLEGSVLGLDADFTLGGPDPAASRGTARLSWLRADEVIARVDARIEEPSAAPEATEPALGAEASEVKAIRVVVDAHVLPARPGIRSILGALEAPALDALDQLRFDDLRLALESPDLAALGDELDRVAPGYVRMLPPAARSGSLDLEAAVTGSARAPMIDLKGDWAPSPGAQVTVAARGALLAARGDVRIAVRSLDLGRFGDAWTGQTLERLDLAVHDAAPGREGADRAAGIDPIRGQRLVVETLHADLSDATGLSRRLRADGELIIDSTSDTPRLADATLRLTADHLLPTVSRLAGTARLHAGVLAFEGGEVDTVAGLVNADLRVPIGSLVQANGEQGALATWVRDHIVGPAPGPIRVDLTMPALDTAGLLLAGDAEAGDAEGGSRVTGGARLALTIDPAWPARSTGALHVDDLVAILRDRRFVAEQRLALSLADGHLSLAPLMLRDAAPNGVDSEGFDAALGGSEVVVVAEAAADLDPSWQPGSDLLAALGPIRASIHTRGGSEAHDPGDGTDVAAASTGPRLSWAALAGLLGLAPGELDASAEARVDLAIDLSRLADARGRLALRAVEASFRGAPLAIENLSLTLAEGALTLAPVRVGMNGQQLELSAQLPLDPTWQSDQAWGTLLGPVEVQVRAGPSVLGPDAPRLEPMRLLMRLQTGDADDAVGRVLSTNLDLRAQVNLRNPLASTGEAILEDLRLATADRSLHGTEPLRLTLADHRLRLDPASLRGGDGEAPLTLAATADLAARLAVDSGPIDSGPMDAGAAEVIERLDLAVHGTLDAALLSPYLSAAIAGAAARGPIRLDLDVSGRPGDLHGTGSIAGPEAELFLARPYFTRLEKPDLRFVLVDGAVRLESSTVVLNEGTVALVGGRAANGDLDLNATFDDVRYRLDYGLSVTLDGALQYRAPVLSDSSTLVGEVVVERGLVRRYLDPDRQLLQAIFAGTPASSGDVSALAEIGLDLTVRTENGVRVKNNLADLRASWSTLNVRGTLAAPQVVGRIDTDPNGYIFAFGQTLRLDRGTLTLSGDPLIEPDFDFVVTSAAEDPSVRREGASRFPASLRPEDNGRGGAAGDAAGDTAGEAGRGVADYYLNRIAGSLGGALGSLNVAIGQDLLVFGESDPTTRLTVGQDVSPHVSVAASFALRDEGDTTYVLDFHDFGRVEQLVAQVFTTDEEDQGFTLQQIVEIGKRGHDRSRSRLRSLAIDAPATVDGRGLRRAVGFGKGDRLPPGANFDIELDVAEYLRREGYPGADVSVVIADSARAGSEASGRAITPTKRRTAEVAVTVQPGPPVEIVFDGDRPPSRSRRAIETIYRPDLYEPATIEEMRQETVEALQGEGFLDPQVEVVVEVAGGDDPDSPRKVVVRADGGQREKLEIPRYEGVDAQTQAILEARFGDPRSRVRWRIGDASLAQQLRDTLHHLGYPAARIDSVTVEGERPVVRLELGRRQTIASVRIDGLEDSLRASLLAAVDLGDLQPGAPARRDVLGTAALRLERALQARGHAAARVGAALVPVVSESSSGPSTDEGPWTFDVVLTVRGAQRYELADIRFEGREGTRRRWAERATRLEKGADLREEDVAEARRYLYEVGAFTAVIPRTELRDDGTGVVVFDLQERSRFRLAFGGRWASDEGLSSVVDVIDRNAFGRGVRLGLRARYAEDDQSLRGLATIPNVLGTKATLDLFVVGRDRDEDGLITSGANGTIQVSVPHGKHTTSRYYVSYTDQTTRQQIDLPIIGPVEVETRLELPILGFQWLRDSRDDRIEPKRGSFLSLDLSGTNETLSSDLTYLRLLAQGQLFRRVGMWRRRSIVWAQSLRIGLADTFDDVPLFRDQRFFAGGEFSVRGYEEDSLGPQDDLGDGRTRARGGEALLVLNEELRVPVTDNLLGVLFFDIGNVYPTLDELDGDLFSAVGIGLRARTPVGLIRGDVAFPLDRREGDDGAQVYLGFGYTF